MSLKWQAFETCPVSDAATFVACCCDTSEFARIPRVLRNLAVSDTPVSNLSWQKIYIYLWYHKYDSTTKKVNT